MRNKSFFSVNIFTLSSIALISAITSNAYAGDLGQTRPVGQISGLNQDPVRSEEFNGFFIGGKLGVGINENRANKLEGAITATDKTTNVVSPLITSYKRNTSGRTGFASFISGGYDHRIGDMVIGSELNIGYDGSGARFRSSENSDRFTQDFNINSRIRVGYVAMPSMLVYGFAGIGLANTEYRLLTSFGSSSSKRIQPQASVGVGVEYAIGSGWSVKGEYEYARGLRTSYTGSFASVTPTTIYNAVGSSISSSDTHRLMAGVNYRFR